MFRLNFVQSKDVVYLTKREVNAKSKINKFWIRLLYSSVKDQRNEEKTRLFR